MNNLMLQILGQVDDGVILFNVEGKVLYDNMHPKDTVNLIQSDQIINTQVMAEVTNAMTCPADLPKEIQCSGEPTGSPDINLTLMGDKDTFCIFVRNQKAKKKFDALRSNLFDLINHELRTPMHGYMGGIQLIVEMLSDENFTSTAEFTELAGITIESSGKVIDKMRRLLELAEFYGDEPIRCDERITMTEVIHNAIQSTADRLNHKKITLMFEPSEDDIGTIYGSTSWLTRALEECIRNSVDHSPVQGEIHLDLQQNSDFLTLTLRDYGQGMPKEVGISFFEPFTGGSEKENYSNQGLGIGLTLAQWIIEIHGGHIRNIPVDEGVQIVIDLPTGSHQIQHNETGLLQAQLYARDLAHLVNRKKND